MVLTIALQKQLSNFHLKIEFALGREIGVLFGPSGSGKSITLRLIAGLLAPDQGQVVLGGQRLYDLDAAISLRPQERSIGHVFQNHALFPHLSVLENIMYGARGVPKRERVAMANELMAKFQIEAQAAKYPHQISGGQQQRAALARAIIKKPKLLLLDEPFSALDTPTRIEVRERLKMIQQELKIPVILVTHDLFEAYSLADTMMVLINGSIVQQGSPKEIMEAPVSSEVKRLVCLEKFKLL